MSKPSDFIRWYERQPKLAQAVKLMVLLPNELQTVIGNAILVLIDQTMEHPYKYSSGIRSLGGDRVMGLHKSKNKRREYDQNETLHKAMNILYLLSTDDREFLAAHILKMLDYFQQYFAACQAAQASPSTQEVAALAKHYTTQGAQATDVLLNNIKQTGQEAQQAATSQASSSHQSNSSQVSANKTRSEAVQTDKITSHNNPTNPDPKI